MKRVDGEQSYIKSHPPIISPNTTHLWCRNSRHMKRNPMFEAVSLLSVFICVHLWLLLTITHAEPTIRNITVEGNTRTRTEIIQRELLFLSGQPLDTLKIAETERNLRRLFFLGNVNIQVQIDSSFADLTVQVKDLYARALSPLLSGNTDELSYGFTALDYNFLGRGQITQLTLFHDAITGNSARLFYRNPRLNNSRHTFTSNLGIADEGHHVILSLTHPFYALAASWNYGINIYNQEQIQRRYRGGVLNDKYSDRISGGNIWFIRSYGNSVKARPGFQLSLSDRRFTPEPNYTYTRLCCIKNSSVNELAKSAGIMSPSQL
jgi:outer membrane protein assembly factor BamA